MPLEACASFPRFPQADARGATLNESIQIRVGHRVSVGTYTYMCCSRCVADVHLRELAEGAEVRHVRRPGHAPARLPAAGPARAAAAGPHALRRRWVSSIFMHSAFLCAEETEISGIYTREERDGDTNI